MNNIKKIIYPIFFILILISCTNKNSNIGFPGSNIKNLQTVVDYTTFNNFSSYHLDIETFPSNSKIIVGNYKGIDSRILFKFTNLPTKINLIEDPVIKFFINHKYNPQNINLKIGLLENFVFDHNYANWTQYNNTDEWNTPGGDFTESSSLILDYDVVTDSTFFSFSIPKNIVQEWIDSNNTNYGLIIYAYDTEDSFIDFYSSKAGIEVRPNISLKYNDSNNIEITDTRNVTQDTFIHNKQAEQLSINEMMISNIAPKSIYFSFDLNKDYFDEVNTDYDFRKININQAYLIFSIDPENTLSYGSYLLGIGIPHTKPDINNLSSEFDINKMWLFSSTRDMVDYETNTIKINITPIVQHIISNNRPNNGVYIINNQKNMDFSHIKLLGLDAEDENLKPVINIKYSILD